MSIETEMKIIHITAINEMGLYMQCMFIGIFISCLTIFFCHINGTTQCTGTWICGSIEFYSFPLQY